MTKTKHRSGRQESTQEHRGDAAGAEHCGTQGPQAADPATNDACRVDTKGNANAARHVSRGLSAQVPTNALRSAIWRRTLTLANRFRVIRTVDIAVACFPEREYKAALTGAQRAMRGMVRASLLKRYRTDRFQTVYGLTQRGAEWLEEAGIDAAASVRRVSDMTNPEHRAWAQFLVLCAEARGLSAFTEAELLKDLNRGTGPNEPPVQGPLRVQVLTTGNKTRTAVLRPDALVIEVDGASWLEVDRSARGSDRAASLRALVLSIGADLVNGHVLRRVVVLTKTERIYKRVLALLAQLAAVAERGALVRGRRQLREIGRGEYEVWQTRERKYADGRSSLVDRAAGHVVVQPLPTWLPKVRLDGRGASSTAGWLAENYLPYRRPAGLPAWDRPQSPLLRDFNGEHIG